MEIYSKHCQSWSTLLWYRCYYPHRSRDALSPICGIFVVVEEVYTEYGLQEGVCFTACVVENYFLLLKFYLMKIKYIFFYKYIPHPFNHLSIKWPFSSKSSKHHNSKTVWSRDLKYWNNVHHPLCVMCHVSCVMCHMSHVMCHMSPVTCHKKIKK